MVYLVLYAFLPHGNVFGAYKLFKAVGTKGAEGYCGKAPKGSCY